MSKGVKDRRRFGIIEVEQVANHCFYLKIGGKLWSEVEWSPSRRTWCIQDACGHCLTHCDSIVGQDIDQRAAIAEAKAMIRDGRMPTPEEAQAAMEERQHGRRETDASELAGEQLPMPLLEDDLSVPMPLLQGLRSRDARNDEEQTAIFGRFGAAE